MPFIIQHQELHAQHWIVSNPQRLNAVNLEMALELCALVKKWRSSQEDQPPLLVIRWPGISTKSTAIAGAGGDQKELANYSASQARLFASKMQQFCWALTHIDAVVISVAEATMIGGASECFLFGDIRLAADQCNLDFRQLQVGLPTGFGGERRLYHLIGAGLTQKIIYLSQSVTIQDSLQWGLVHKSAPDLNTLNQEVDCTIRQLSQIDRRVIIAQKRLMANALDGKSSIAGSSRLFASCWKNPQHQKSLDRFKSKGRASD